MDPLTARQQEILNYIADVRSARGVAPLLREVAAAFSVGIPNVQQHVNALKRKGYLSVDPFAHRGIRLTTDRKEWKVRQEWRNDFEKRFGTRLRGETDLAKTYAIVRGELRAWLDVDAAELLIHDSVRRELRDGAFYGHHKPEIGNQKPETRDQRPETRDFEDLSAVALRRRKPVVVSERERPEIFRAEAGRRPGIRSCAAVPILGRDRVVGILRLDDRRRADGFDEVKLARAALAAGALLPAIEQGTLHADLQRRIRMQAALVSLCRAINGRTDLQKMLTDVHDLVSGLVDSPVFIIAVTDDAGRWWLLLMTDVVDGRPWKDDRIQKVTLSGNEALQMIQTQPYYIKHRSVEEVERLEAADRAKRVAEGTMLLMGSMKRSRSMMYVPLKTEGAIIGYIACQSYRYNEYSVREAEDLILIGEYIGLAVQNTWRREKEKTDRDAAGRVLERTRRFADDARRIAEAKDREGLLRETETLAADLAEAVQGTDRPAGPRDIATPP